MNSRNISKPRTCLAIFSLILFSQALPAMPDSSGFQPEIEVQQRYEDNVRRAPEQNKQNDSILVLKPGLPLLWDFGKHTLNLTYKGEYAQYSDQKILNYSSHYLSSHLLLDHNHRLNTEYEFGYIRERDIPGDNNVLVSFTAEPNQWEEKYAKTSLLFGKNTSQGQIITRFEYRQRRYINNNQQFLDRNKVSLSSSFYYRIAPNTRIPFEISITDYDYQNTASATNPGNNEYRYLTGITWDVTAKSTGIFQFGLLEKKYDSPLFNDTSIVIVQLDGEWKPNTYTKIMFGTLRNSQESSQPFLPAYTKNQLYSEITHMITPRTRFLLDARYTAAKANNPAAINNDRVNIRIEAEHNLLRWLYAGIGYNFVERNSGRDAFNFKTNILTLKIRAQFND